MNAIPTASPPRVLAGAAAPREAREAAQRTGGASVRLRAGIAGGLWLMVIITGAFAFFATSRLMVDGDAVATAANLLASESAFRLAFTANLVAGACYLGVTVLLYALLKPVSRSLSLLAATFGLAGVAAGAAASLLQLAPLLLLKEAPYLGAFTPGQLQALAQTFLRMAWQGGGIGMMFFGVQCAVIGALIVRSTFLPSVLGVLLGVGGASYVVSSLASFTVPALGAQLSPFIVPIALIGEGSLCVWLIWKGVNVPGWQEQAGRQ